MKKNRISQILAIVFFLVLSGSAMAQVPGYVGKRVHIQAGVNFFPQFTNYPVNMVHPYGYYVVSGMNWRLSLGTDFVITRKSSIGLNGNYFSTAATPGGYGSGYDNRYAIDGGSIGVVFKTRFGPWVAPLGPYFKAEAGAIIYSISDPANNFAGTFPAQTVGNGYISLGIGRTHIFANRISLDYGGEMAMVFPPYDYSLVGSSNIRMAIHYAATVFVKVGVIL